jgi:N-acetylglutamate synthase/N-acetylornithine aminotransferase
MSVTRPLGFRAAGVTAGLKASGRPDVALVVNDGPQHAVAAVFTTNRVEAAPVTWSRQVVADGRADAVFLNSGGANACTGAPGFQDTHRTAELVAEALDVGAGDVVVCSTGLIGERLPMDKIEDGLDLAVAALTDEGGTCGLVRRGHGQGRRNACAGARHDARRPHDRRRHRGRRPRRRPAGGDRGLVRPDRLRRLHVDQ